MNLQITKTARNSRTVRWMLPECYSRKPESIMRDGSSCVVGDMALSVATYYSIFRRAEWN